MSLPSHVKMDNTANAMYSGQIYSFPPTVREDSSVSNLALQWYSGMDRLHGHLTDTTPKTVQLEISLDTCWPEEIGHSWPLLVRSLTRVITFLAQDCDLITYLAHDHDKFVMCQESIIRAPPSKGTLVSYLTRKGQPCPTSSAYWQSWTCVPIRDVKILCYCLHQLLWNQVQLNPLQNVILSKAVQISMSVKHLPIHKRCWVELAGAIGCLC